MNNAIHGPKLSGGYVKYSKGHNNRCKRSIYKFGVTSQSHTQVVISFWDHKPLEASTKLYDASNQRS